MATKKNSFIGIDLDWAEEQLRSWRAYVDARPIETLKDRIEWKPTKSGGQIPMVIASVEQQGKFLQDTVEKYIRLLGEVDRLREDEAKKIQTRAGSQMNGMMQAKLGQIDK